MVEGQVYFLHAPDVRRIKIGRSIDIERRLSEIRLLSPVMLYLLGAVPGGASVETAYHREWSHLRQHGEWFMATDELITRLQADSLVSAWNRACPEARELAMEQIDGPVFDRTRSVQG